MDYVAINDAIRSTGVGLAGFEGAWWSPATQPFEMTSAEFNQLSHIGRSLFQYADAITAELREQPDSYFSRQLQQKVPVHIVETFSTAPMLMCRPDFQLVPTPDGVQLVLTEIEIAPFSAGCAHAMQIAYGIPADIAPAFARMLHGRELLFVGTHEWSWYLYDQFAFCKALAVHGARGRILSDRTFDQMETEIQRGERWQLPIPGIEQPPDPWQPGITAHINRFDLQSHVCNEWPEDLGDAVIYRFGYVEHFTPAQHAIFRQWQEQGATFLNPFSFHLDSKVLLLGARTPSIRKRLDTETVAALERCVPETVLLTSNNLGQLVAEKNTWLIKFAGFDQANTAWGGRSVRFGRQFSSEAWRKLLRESLNLNWPVVAQHVTDSMRLTLDYYQSDGSIATLQKGYTRLRTFFLRNDVQSTPHAVHCGSHITVTGDTMNVSEQARGAIQSPVHFHLRSV